MAVSVPTSRAGADPELEDAVHWLDILNHLHEDRREGYGVRIRGERLNPEVTDGNILFGEDVLRYENEIRAYVAEIFSRRKES